MLNLINTRILISGATVLAAAAIIIGGTFAFFSDTETSTGNTLVAGEIDLKIDNTSYVTDSTGTLVASPNTSWNLRDLTVERFFDFRDLKPGDIGEDTISIHVGSNDAWMCAAAQITDDSDQSCTDPENADDPTCADPGLGQGELDEDVNFAFWVDDGDNVFETDESTFLSGPLSGLGQQGQITLADSLSSILGSTNPIPGGTTFFIGKAWCFGNMTPNQVLQDNGLDVGRSPITEGTGFTCDGTDVDNAAQTDKVMGDLQFFAVQSRNNDEFTCADGFTPVFPIPTGPPGP